MARIIRTNCPRDCYDGCGIVVELENGKQPRVGGDPEHPISRGALCAKCGVAYNGVLQDEGARLTTPLRRTGRKGSGEFEAIDWDTALEEIAGRLAAIVESNGPESILTMKYSGTLSLIAFFFPDRWVNHVGASVVDYGTICNAAGGVAWNLQFGTAYKGFDPRTARDSDSPQCARHGRHDHLLARPTVRRLGVHPDESR